MFFTEKRKGKDKDKDTGIGIGIARARGIARANGSVFIGLLFMLLFFAVIILAYPKYFLFLFQSIFGILLLSVFVIGIGYVDVRWAIGMALFFIILYLTLHLASSKKEPFEQQGQVWTQQTIDKFKSYQQSHNPDFVYDITILQQQVSPADVDYLVENNKWNWSPEIQQMYIDAIQQNNIISYDSASSLSYEQSLYNETAIKQLLSWNTKEGNFLLNGAVIGHSKKMPKNVNNVVKCFSLDGKGGDSSMHKIVYNGYNAIYSNMNKEITPVSNEELPNLVAGFHFLREPCNPCLALNNPASLSCPFSINTGNGNEVSDIWQNLWQLGSGSGSESGSGSGSGSGQEKNGGVIPFPSSYGLGKDTTHGGYINANFANSRIGVIPIDQEIQPKPTYVATNTNFSSGTQ